MIQAWKSLLRRRAAPETVSDSTLPGLEAFGAETPTAPHPPSARRMPSSALLALLGALALVQMVPTVLWVRGLLTGTPEPSAATAPVEGAHGGDAPSPAAARAVDETSPTTGMEPSLPLVQTSAAEPAGTPTAREASAGPAPIQAGLLSVDAPVPMQVRRRGRLVGTSEVEAIMLPLGTHELEFASDVVGYRVVRTVTIEPGRTTRIRIPARSGVLHVNALPWAEVWVDGQPTGETPLGNLEAPIGTREIVFRHPELGERRQTVLVTLLAPARVSVDLRQP
jgi:hypothetical protein